MLWEIPLQKLEGSSTRIIAIGDIHEQRDLVQDLIENSIKFDASEDALIFLGDYLNRGGENGDAEGTLDYITDLARSNPGRVILLKGNHECMIQSALQLEVSDVNLLRLNGGEDKLEWEPHKKDALLKFCQSLPKYYELDKFFFVHANVHRDIAAMEQSDLTLMWTVGENWGYKGKKVVCGHEIVSEVKNTEHYVKIDLGAFKSNRLAAYDVLNNKTYYARR